MVKSIINVRRSSICWRGRRELITDVRKPEIMVMMSLWWRRAIYWLPDHPRKLVTLNLKLKINRRRTLPASSRWWDAYRKQLGLKDFSPKSQDAVLQQIKEPWRFTYDWSWWYPSGNRPLQQYLGFTVAGYGQFEHKADSLIAKFKEAGGTVREIDVWAESPRLSPLWLSVSSSACHGLLIITVITLLFGKAQRDKNAENQLRERGNYWHADASAWCCCARCKIHEGVSLMLKLENDARRDDVAAGRRRLHIKAVCQSVREATIASGVDNAALWLADTAERDYFTLRERLITMQKQLEGTQKYINEIV